MSKDVENIIKKASAKYSQLKARIKKKYGGDTIEKYLMPKDKFLSWYSKEYEDPKCEYCGITEEESINYYNKIAKNRTPWGKKGEVSKRGKTLEIDRKRNKDWYLEGNCALVCYYCNNAKSDVFEYEEFRDSIGQPGVYKIIKSKLESK